MDKLGILHAKLLTKYICVLIHIRINGEIGTVKLV